MKDGNPAEKKNSKKAKHRVFKPRKKKSVEEDAAIKYLQAQYETINADSIKTFKDFPLSQKTLKGLKDNNYNVPTDIQRQSIGYALQGKDILGAAKTGSGKTLAFIIPILENLFCKKWTRMDGVGALVISPTRELAYQIYGTLRKVGNFHDFSAGLIIGGQNLKFERKRMDQINILICTPGRLLQHMDENPLFDCSNLQILVLDEADRCLDLGFEATMNAIIENLPTERQTLLFSATQTKSVKDLARLSLSFPTYVAPHDQAVAVTPESLQQSYIVCEIDEKLAVLWSFIKNHLKQKVIVFMATCKEVKYIYDLFCKLRPGVSLLALYGTLHQEKREKIYEEFCRKSNVILFATDLASRGLDFPRVNWVIQYDCPEDVDTYIHRAGRTARGVLGKGEGLLILLPQEEKIVQDLQSGKIPINKISVDPSKIIFPQKKIETLLSDSSDLKQTAQRAFVSYLKSIYLMKNKDIFQVHKLDTDAYARSLGLIVPPIIKFMNKYKYNKSNQLKIDTSNDDSRIVKPTEKIGNENESEEFESHSEEDNNERIMQQMNITKTKKEIPQFNFHVDDDFENAGDNILVQKQKNISLKFTPLPAELLSTPNTILKRNIKMNTNINFSDTDEDDTKKNEDKEHVLAQSIKNAGRLDPEKTIALLRQEDKHDVLKFREKIKAMHKEEKRKLKNKKKEDEGEQDEFGSHSESDGPDLSWLPDPDKVYRKNDENEIEQESENSSEDSAEDDEYYRPPKRKLVDKNHGQKNIKSGKVRKVEKMAAGLSIQEAEAFAMQLLKSK